MFINTPFHGGFGLLTNQGIPKPVFWALKLLSQVYDQRLVLPRRTNEDIEYAAFTDGTRIQILLYAQEMDHEVNRTFQIDLSVNEVFETAKVIRIDDDHCDPKRIWQEMGAPMDLTPQQVREIKEQSSLVEKTLNPQIIQGESHMKLELSSNDVILITLE